MRKLPLLIGLTVVFCAPAMLAQDPASTAAWGPDGGSESNPLVFSSLLVNTSSGPRLWLGGNFCFFGKTTGRAAWFDPATANVNSSFAKINAAEIGAIAPYGTGWIVAGQSLNADALGNPLGLVTLVDSDGAVNSSFRISVNAPVEAVAVVGQNILIGGQFTTVNGQSRSHAAMVNASGGLTSWDPQLNFGPLVGTEASVTAITANQSTIFLGGNFVSAGGSTSPGLVGVDGNAAQAVWTQSDQIEAVGGLVVQGSRVFAGVDRRVGSSFASFIDIFDASSGALITSISTNSLAQTLAIGLNTPLYVGGFEVFALGTGQLSSLVALNPDTGILISSFNPQADSTVASIALSGSTLYVGGNFHNIGGQQRDFLAAVDATTGRATAWRPEPGDLVNVVVAAASTVVAGGFFSTANAVQRTQFAEVDPVTGTPTSFSLNLNGSVVGMATDGNTVFLVGGFNAVNGVTRNHAVAVDLSTRQLTAFNPPNADTLDFEVVDVDRKNVYIGGSWNFLQANSGRVFGIRNLAAFSKSTGSVQTGFHPNPNGTVQSISVAPSGPIYVGGQFNTIGNAFRNGVAALTPSASVLGFNPNVQSITGSTVVRVKINHVNNTVLLFGSFSSVANQMRANLAEVDPTTGIPSNWSPSTNDPVNAAAIDPTNGVVCVGGAFITANLQPREGVAAFDSAGQLGSTLVNTFGFFSGVRTLQLFVSPSGSKTLDIAGDFSSVNGAASPVFAAVPVP